MTIEINEWPQIHKNFIYPRLLYENLHIRMLQLHPLYAMGAQGGEEEV
jgi:hypothetical protein